MPRKFARALAWFALVGSASAAADGGFFIGRSWGDVAYRPAADTHWQDGKVNKLLLGYDFGGAPVSFELARLESSRSEAGPNIDFETCGCVVAGVTPYGDFSAWYAAAGYRLWRSDRGAGPAHFLKGSSLVLKGGLYDAESASSTGPGSSRGGFSSSRGVLLGAAGTLMLTPFLGVRFEWEYLDELRHRTDGGDNDRYDASQTMAGVVVKFGGGSQ
jgi:hypothetical protein